MKNWNLLCFALAAFVLSGCCSSGTAPLLFGQQQTIGFSLGGSATEQGGDLTFGYKGKNIAAVPVVTTSYADGSSSLVRSTIDNNQDAMSVLGQFEVVENNPATEVGLGKFFAVGLPARKLAEGFRDQLKK